MNPALKALWYIETHFNEEIGLDDIAKIAGVSRFHLTRVFAVAQGQSVMRYVRARRLSEAARVLAAGAADILTVALDAGYHSHEAFTRAFREQFGRTPEALRAEGELSKINLQEPIKMDETLLMQLDPPRIVDGRSLLIAGLSERYSSETAAGMPAQWQKFVPHIGHIPGQIGSTAYGVLCNGDNAGNTDYICGVEVSDFSHIPASFARLRIPEHKYAVFTHKEHISGIRRTWFTIFNKWLPESGYKITEAPEFELYDECFNGITGEGGLEIWIPIKT